MMHHSEVARIPLENPHAQTDPLQLAVAAYLARFTGSSRDHASSDLCDVQIAARHADPRTTMRYDRARKNLDRHPNYILLNYILAAYMASGT